MAINFCHSALKPVLTSEKVQRDGFSVSNLVEISEFYRNGFMAEYFIRTPLSVYIAFPLNIEIDRILIDGRIGRHKSSRFDVWSCSFRRNAINTWFESSQLPATACKPDLVHSCLGRGHLAENESCLLFVNKNFRPRASSGCQTPPSGDYPVFELRCHDRLLLNNCSQLIIRILQAEGSSAPCIQRLQVWGQPSASTPQPIVDKVYSLVSSLTPRGTPAAATDPTVTAPSEPSCSMENDLNEIPAEYLDELTLDVMTRPMFLPSGHVIDQSTIDKYCEEERKFGRLPNDPFTAVMFDSSNQPTPFTALKIRISEYLVKHHVPGLGQMLGSRASSSKPVESNPLPNQKRAASPSPSEEPPRQVQRVELVHSDAPLSHEEKLKTSLQSALDRIKKK